MNAQLKEENLWFKNWFNSTYYHKLYAHRDEQEAAAFIDTLLNTLNLKPHSRLLDIGCGKGRHSIYLASKGFDVTGIDISTDSIEEALKSQFDHLEFYVHDMRFPFRINYYDYAFNFFTSFGFFNTFREHDNAIRTFAQSLKRNGLLVMDYLNAHYVENHLQYKSETEIEGVRFLITRWLDETHFYKKIVVEDENKLSEPLEFTEKVAKFSLGEFNDMFSYHGLQLQEVYGDYHLAPYDVQSSPRLIMIARKIH